MNIQDKHGVTPLHLAIKSKQDLFDTVTLLVTNGADIHIKDFSGNNALIYAAENNIPGGIRKQFHWNFQFNHELSLFSIKTKNKYQGIVGSIVRLVAKGVDVKSKNNENNTALHFAARNG